ncbi:hydroxyisourate hydrolase [Paenibacillus sp. HB172176]|uniref:hydroxyisourate hydrolase n=1 Tax=Paenibacillus sp. HB172176 TaxID=2493690 RepID=UPI001439AB9E|nr:hydroxyisourate hydrolase [Paenibacillus sp. HB172176]
MGKITTHVLDTVCGKPARGLALELYRMPEGGGSAVLLASRLTNEDGRLNCPMLEGEAMLPGNYELRFRVGDYFEKMGDYSESIWHVIPIGFKVREVNEHYHVPLLLAPGGYSTYRGS